MRFLFMGDPKLALEAQITEHARSIAFPGGGRGCASHKRNSVAPERGTNKRACSHHSLPRLGEGGPLAVDEVAP